MGPNPITKHHCSRPLTLYLLLSMHDDVKCFNFLPLIILLERSVNGVLLGFSELFSKFYVTEEYSEAAKMFRVVYTPTMEGENDSLEVFLWPCVWNFPLKIFYYNDDATNGETKVEQKKNYRTSKKQ